MEFVPILIPTGTKSLRVLYKYFIVVQQQIPDAQRPGWPSPCLGRAASGLEEMPVTTGTWHLALIAASAQ